MLVNIEDEQKVLKLENKILENVKRAIKLCLEMEGFTYDGEVNVYFVDNERIRQINQQQREKDEPTDVLSFPMLDMIEGQYELDDLDKNLETGALILGDIVVSVEKAVEQSEKYDHSLLREIVFLIVHGLFHLLGYDHQDKAQEYKMFKKQDDVLKKMEIGRGGSEVDA